MGGPPGVTEPVESDCDTRRRPPRGNREGQREAGGHAGVQAPLPCWVAPAAPCRPSPGGAGGRPQTRGRGCPSWSATRASAASTCLRICSSVSPRSTGSLVSCLRRSQGIRPCACRDRSPAAQPQFQACQQQTRAPAPWAPGAGSACSPLGHPEPGAKVLPPVGRV